MKLSAAGIEAMDRAALIAAWTGLFQSPAPKGLSQSFLRRFLAFEVQARQLGGLPKDFMVGLERRVAGAIDRPGPTLKPGGRLLREWNGTTHAVEVAEGGYRWNGQTYRSLTAVAHAITGARWSGPRFFGLRDGF
ncbi:MAG: DUF2924 domain-containing protein [Paracoccaceae bacterium]|nr:DUF2924 domain-containing protein [Paracoccaceae bacterium]MDH5529657.1 DUF2924 domain-containing protein [Paracoccaceae bacterium]